MAALVAALGLAACGRKGPLDAPPAALAEPAPAASAAPAQPQAQEERSLFGDPSQRGPSAAPVAPKGQKKSIPLDVLLN
jgi:predicted small lipoprotein YifL